MCHSLFRPKCIAVKSSVKYALIVLKARLKLSQLKISVIHNKKENTRKKGQYSLGVPRLHDTTSDTTKELLTTY